MSINFSVNMDDSLTALPSIIVGIHHINIETLVVRDPTREL